MYYIGIDPGSKGAICLLNPMVSTAWFIDLSETDYEIYSILKRATPGIARAALEDVHSLPGMSAKSNFGFGKQVGRIQTILNILAIPFDLVTPKVWQKECEIPTRKNLPKGIDLKQYVAQEAQRLYPEAQLHGARGGLMDGRSDALMIAHYVRKTYGGWHALQANNEGSTSLVPDPPSSE